MAPLNLKPGDDDNSEEDKQSAAAENPKKKKIIIDLGNGSELLHIPRFISYQESWSYFEYLDKTIPWTRPTIRVFAKSHVQPRDTCYIADEGLPKVGYSGYHPHAHSWHEFPPLKDILELVHKALPGSSFNSLLLNRYKGGADYVGWHSDEDKLYGPTPQIASISFGCDRDFFLKKKPSKSTEREEGEPPPNKRSKKVDNANQQSIVLKHGSLLVMSGYTQRDWIHSVPKRAKAESIEGFLVLLSFAIYRFSCPGKLVAKSLLFHGEESGVKMYFCIRGGPAKDRFAVRR